MKTNIRYVSREIRPGFVLPIELHDTTNGSGDVLTTMPEQLGDVLISQAQYQQMKEALNNQVPPRPTGPSQAVVDMRNSLLSKLTNPTWQGLTNDEANFMLHGVMPKNE